MKFNRIIIFTIAIHFFVTTNLISQTDSLSQIYKALELDTLDNNIVQKIYDNFYSIYKINQTNAAEIASVGIQLAMKFKDSLLLARMQNLRAIAILQQGTYFMALQIFFDNYQFFLKNNSQIDLAQTLKYIGITYLYQKISDIANQKFDEALKIYQQLGDSINVASIYRYKAISYAEIEPQLQKSFLIKSKQLLEKYKDNQELADTYFELANYYFDNSNYSEALNYVQKAMHIYHKLNQPYELTKTYMFSYKIYKFLKNEKEITDYFIKTIELCQKYGFEKLRIQAYIDISKIHIENKFFYKARNYADSALLLAEKLEDVGLLAQTYKLQALVAQYFQNQHNAIYFLNKYIEYREKEYQEQQSSHISSFQLNLELQNIENNLTLYKMNAEKAQLELIRKQYRKNIIFISIILALGLLVLIFVIIQFLQRRKTAKQLHQKNEQLNKEIEERKRAEIEALNNENRFRLLFNQTPIGIIQINENLHITHLNGKIADIFNRPINELINTHINNILDRKIVMQISEILKSTEESVLNLTSEIPTKSQIIYVSLTIKKYLVQQENESHKSVIIIVQDLTEQKKAERLYNLNVQSKEKLLKNIQDNFILINENEDIKAIHFPFNKHLEMTASKLSDLFSEEILTIIRTNLYKITKTKEKVQFTFNENNQNYFVRINTAADKYIIQVTQLPEKLENIEITSSTARYITGQSDYNFANMQNEIKQDLIPIYQNIQKGLSFLMIKNFAEKIITIGKKYNNSKLIDYGEKVFDGLTSFNISKVNNLLDSFPEFISEILFLSNKI